MTTLKEFVTKGLLNGALNTAGFMLMFGGSDMIDFTVPFLGGFTIPDAAVLAAAGTLGQVVSDVVHDVMYKTIPASEKMRQSETALASIAAYSASQIPLLYLGNLPLANYPQYLTMSAGIHYASERIYHDILDKSTGGIIL